ncbi:MAG: hypothetical protein JNK84_08555 [Phreatobacter sp.]|uniref:hypothetical protein n=1 Tax=Phreatobacter sp. TaxID=1966341 RepID=UPI001A62608B|nr:hypothetical protein [Phreatobacter sp.]MBL8569122.1 hypothetical protein [Phreatobacter sp.]
MATIALDKIDTVSATAGKIASGASATATPGFWRTLWNTIVDAQELRANTYVNGYLAHLTDGELSRLGMTRDQMIRRTRSMMTSL